MKRIPCVLMCGETSTDAFLLDDDLPKDLQQRDEFLLAIMGSGYALEMNGIGERSPQSSKVTIISQSLSDKADIDYLSVQVSVNQLQIDTLPNDGNMLCAAGDVNAFHKHPLILSAGKE
ncbi:hypothetical protein FE839_16610 [Klebsiella indica]|uniref:Uncharacterized protein n=1 Tax=Klebsiella indica TaxID=2582917 RepID=A0A5R9LEU3_9ENTR|nr:PrpF domain-containing protein [Klebsiella indica]TLV14003.1 hypothetical protein FE839_16610 [Klebsiella indica]